MEKYLKKILILIIFMVFFVRIEVYAGVKDNLINNKYNNVILKGIAYDNGLMEVKNKNQLNAKFKIDEMSFQEGIFNILGTLNFQGMDYSIKTQGNVYKSETLYLGENSITIPLNKSGNFEFLSCTIEKSAKKDMLLPANRDFEGCLIIKLVIKDNLSNQIIQFEDLLPKKINFDNILDQRKEVTNEIEELLMFQEQWFYSYLQKPEEVIGNEEEALGVDYITKVISKGNVVKIINNEDSNNENYISAYATSPVYGIGSGAFTSVGQTGAQTNEAFGYFRTTYEWPLGTGNLITQLIKWNTITQQPVPGGAAAVSNLCVEAQGKYLYNKVDGTIKLYDARSCLRIKKPVIQFALLTENSDIITKITKSVTSNNTKISINWTSWIGLLPYGSNFVTFTDLLTSVQLKQDPQVSNIITNYDRISDSMKAWGKVIKDYKLDIPSDRYLSVEGDKVEILASVKKPVDAATYYTYVTSNRKAGYKFEFAVYSQDGLGFYTNKEYTHSKTIYRTY